jgi:putative transposase
MADDPNLPARRSIRLKAYDYSQPGLYFVTICTHDLNNPFGIILNGEMRLNQVGKVAHETWLELPMHFPAVELHAHVIMPNHIHGALAILKRARHAVPLRSESNPESFGKPVAASLPTVVRSYKAAVSGRVRAILGKPSYQVWQRNYYERVVRTGDEFREVCRYIIENPQHWAFDKENPDHLEP